MKLTTTLSSHDNAVAPGVSERAQSLCARAKELEEAGEFEEARAAISEFWQRIGERPRLEGLSPIAQADLILRAGTLSGWIGSARQISGAQEIAKDLISESSEAFAKLGLVERVAEAKVDLGICYWRAGAFDEARITLDDALQGLGDIDSEQRLRAFLNKAIVEKVSNRYRDALRIHREAAPLFDVSANHALKGKFHNAYAMVLQNLGMAQQREDYLDHALIEFSAASFHFEQAQHKRFQGVVENNLGFLFSKLGRFKEAHEHLSRSRAVALGLKDQGLVAQVDDTRAMAFIAQGQFSRAETISRSSVKALEAGDQFSMLAEALTRHGTALARLGSFSIARASLDKAIRVARQAGDPESGGVAALVFVEEFAGQIPHNELLAYFQIADAELKNSQYPEILDRLGKCARLILATTELAPVTISEGVSKSLDVESIPQFQPGGSTDDSEGDSLVARVLHYEGDLIRRALEASEGSVTRAARLLGVTHQGLAFILNGRHKNLLPARKPAKPRRRSIIRYH